MMPVTYRELGELMQRLRRVARLGTCGEHRTEQLARQCADLIEALHEYIKEPGPFNVVSEIDMQFRDGSTRPPRDENSDSQT